MSLEVTDGPSAMAGPAEGFVGVSPQVQALRETAAGIARRRSTVMILGETGSGKEVLARYIHERSGRAGPFVPVDCSAISETLFESQLFGHVRGAFTGASRDNLGSIRAADGGTLFLDEIGELGLHLQSKLLRVIQERQVTPVGEARPVGVDVRIVVATHRNLRKMVETGAFREDLYFRLNVVVLELPPLRERPDDIVPLARSFLEAQADLYGESTPELAAEVVECLHRYSWPGNCRELGNVMESAYVMADGGRIELEHLPARIRRPVAGDGPLRSELRLVDVERAAIEEALRRSRRCKAAASRLLGIDVRRLNRRIRSLGIVI